MRSTSFESLVTEVPLGRSMRTGGSSRPNCGGLTKAARQPNISGNNFTLFALTTLPVSASMSAYPRSPTRPRGVSSATESCSPFMDLTGNLQSPDMDPTTLLSMFVPPWSLKPRDDDFSTSTGWSDDALCGHPLLKLILIVRLRSSLATRDAAIDANLPDLEPTNANALSSL